MKKYLDQLLNDIEAAIAKLPAPPEGGYELWEWVSEEEENRNAPIRNLQEWTSIYVDMLPSESLLNEYCQCGPQLLDFVRDRHRNLHNCRRQFLVLFSLASSKRHRLIKSSPIRFFLSALCVFFVSPPRRTLWPKNLGIKEFTN